jgi:cytochrome c biogenesis factor
MLPEIGHFALILALMATVFQVVLPSVGLWRGNFALTQLSKPLLSNHDICIFKHRRFSIISHRQTCHCQDAVFLYFGVICIADECLFG